MRIQHSLCHPSGLGAIALTDSESGTERHGLIVMERFSEIAEILECLILECLRISRHTFTRIMELQQHSNQQ